MTKMVSIELPEYIKEVKSEKFCVINTADLKGNKHENVLTAADLTLAELEEALRNFDVVTFKRSFAKTKRNATRLMLDLFLVFYGEYNKREAAATIQ
jgi:hypothetical protein